MKLKNLSLSLLYNNLLSLILQWKRKEKAIFKQASTSQWCVFYRGMLSISRIFMIHQKEGCQKKILLREDFLRRVWAQVKSKKRKKASLRIKNSCISRYSRLNLRETLNWQEKWTPLCLLTIYKNPIKPALKETLESALCGMRDLNCPY